HPDAKRSFATCVPKPSLGTRGTGGRRAPLSNIGRKASRLHPSVSKLRQRSEIKPVVRSPMDVLICGAGIAGLTLAFWLVRGEHRVTLVEKAPARRDEGYMIDFFGSGYDVAEKMGLLPELECVHYPISRFVFVNADGRERLSASYADFRRLFNG